MEMNELRYFLAVAQTENIQRAAKRLAVSPGSLSKAIARLESELGSTLFSREGRNIRLTERGRQMQRRSSEILQLEQRTRAEIGGAEQVLQISLAGEELLLTKYAPTLVANILKRFAGAQFDVSACEPAEVIRRVEMGEAAIGLTTLLPPKHLQSKQLEKIHFKTVVGDGHPLYRRAKSEIIPIEEILKYPFAVPEKYIWGKTGEYSADGWREDKFPRKIGFRVSNTTTVQALVTSGLALAYLPSYFAEALNLRVMKISGCRYSCEQTVQLVTRDPHEVGWMIQAGLANGTNGHH